MSTVSPKGVPTWKLPNEAFKAVTGWKTSGFISRTVEFLDSLNIVPHHGDARAGFCHEVDVAIIGANSLLGAFALLKALTEGQRVLWCVQPGLDGFPVGLYENQAMREAVSAILKRFGLPEVDASIFDESLAATLALEANTQVLVARRNVAFALNNLPCGDRQILYAAELASAHPPTDAFSSLFHQRLSKKGSLVELSTDRAGRHAVLTSSIVLTSMVAPFSRMTIQQDEAGQSYQWGNHAIVPLGTARCAHRRLGDAVKAITDDIGTLAQKVVSTGS